MAMGEHLISDYLLLDFGSEARTEECFELNMYIPDEYPISREYSSAEKFAIFATLGS